ncbi:unnamed protein product [Spirodela intermedia]|uniref:Uncharacterized protein n=1 Tax=Spirodela intermedia TaxID=51605 RepID=A0A7I8JA30_SPIIN|nr:unnamed protein product [Spirodela intermedia]CAA6666949.1 unnamed protein product [Spirodela intermedia]
MDFVLLLLSFLLATSHAAIYPDPVLDSRGNELKRGHQYYVLPAFSGPLGGGLNLVSLNETCPLYVAREESENPDRSAVLEGGTFYAMFAAPTQCTESTVWRAKVGTLTTGGSVSQSIGPHDSRFAIQKSDDPKWAYEISSCPCSVDVDRASCRMGCSVVDSLPKAVVFMNAAVEEVVIRSKA